MQIFNRQKALELVGEDSELLFILLQEFIKTEFSIEHLIQLIQGNKKEEAASYVHRVKGAGRQLAMEKLAQSGQKLEDVLRGKTTGELIPLAEEFYNDYEQALKEAESFMNE